MFVAIHPTQLGKPIKVITGVVKPGYISINSVGEIIVTEPDDNRDVVVLDMEGKML